MKPDFEHEAAKLRVAEEAALADVPTVECKKCKGKGYHHGFGEDGNDPDWCTECGGNQFVVDGDEYERRQLAATAQCLRYLWNAALEDAAAAAMNTLGHAVPDCCRESIADSIRALKATP